MSVGKSEYKPGLLGSLIRNKCTRCRQGNIFQYHNAYDFKNMMKMHDCCTVCGQPLEPEVGFYYGTAYVSYGLSLMICAADFTAWIALIGISLNDNRLFWWMGVNAILLLALQPLLMRLSRTIWLAIFIHYDPEWKARPPARVERRNDQVKNNW
ncbi:MAG: hypothetical protein JWM28_4209 [Chitinophagaceae bacterium]|nr:hypothetical protein [Chitinophagaceae bacterium]